jgi:hypothetical protein
MKADQLPWLVAEAGVPCPVEPEGEGIGAWLDLMETVEALCADLPPPEPRRWPDCRL